MHLPSRVKIYLSVLLLFVGFYPLAAQDTDGNEDLTNLLDSANYYVDSHKHDIGDSLLNLADRQITESSPKDLKAYFHLTRAKWLLNTWQLRDAENDFLNAIAIYTTLGDSSKLLNSYSGLGTTMCEQNSYHEGALYQRKALTFFKVGDQDSLSYYSLLANLAVSYNMAKEVDKALSEYLRVKAFFERNGYDGNVAVVENNIGELYRENFGNHEVAIDHYRKAAELNIAKGQDNHLVQNYHNMNIAFQGLMQYDSSYHYLKKSMVLRERVMGRGGMAISYYALGQLYMRTNKPDSAEWAFIETLTISEERGIEPGMFYGSMGLAELYESQGKTTRAASEYSTALSHAREIGSSILEAEVREKIYHFYKSNQNHKAALEHFEVLNALRDSISQNQNQSRLAEVKTRYEMDIAESENEALKARQEAQELEIERQNWFLLGLSVVLLIIVLATVFLAWANRQRKLALDKEVEAKRELELQYLKVKEQEVKLSEANELKTKIFSVLGHDLRSPLVNISSMLHLISAKEITSDELENLLGHLQLETDLSINTLQNILQWSRMQMNNSAVECKHISVRDTIRDLRQIFESSVRLKSLTLHFSDECGDDLWVDENQFKSIATNLISNAIKFSPSGSSIEVVFRSLESEVLFSVSDRGVGFDETVLNQIHAGAKPVSAKGTSGEKGTGIGLQIVRDFVAAHRGRLELSNNQHGGAAVKVYLPRNSANAEIDDAHAERRSA